MLQNDSWFHSRVQQKKLRKQMFYHPASQNMFAEDKDSQRNCASTEGELSQLIQIQRTSASCFIGNSLPATFSKEPSHSKKSYYCARKTRSTAGNPDPETYLMPGESGWEGVWGFIHVTGHKTHSHHCSTERFLRPTLNTIWIKWQTKIFLAMAA